MRLIIAIAYGVIAIIATIIGFVVLPWGTASLYLGAAYLSWVVVGGLYLKGTESGDAFSTPGVFIVLQMIALSLAGLAMIAIGALWGA